MRRLGLPEVWGVGAQEEEWVWGVGLPEVWGVGVQEEEWVWGVGLPEVWGVGVQEEEWVWGVGLPEVSGVGVQEEEWVWGVGLPEVSGVEVQEREGVWGVGVLALCCDGCVGVLTVCRVLEVLCCPGPSPLGCGPALPDGGGVQGAAMATLSALVTLSAL